MSSRTMSVILCIVCSSTIFWNVKAMTDEVTTDNPKTSISTGYLSPNGTESNAEGTTLSPTRNSSANLTSSNENTTTLYSTELSLETTPTSMTNNQSSVNISGPSTVTVTATFLTSVTVPVTGHRGSTDSKTDNTTTTTTTTKTTITTEEKSQTNVTVTIPMETTTTLFAGTNSYVLKYSETVLTSIFSTVLVVVILTILVFSFKKYKKRRNQYSHHPLRESSYDSADRYSQPDDTLVISGGLYDAPRIYNPNMTVLEEDESHNDFVSFNSRPGQFRLEFLPDDSAFNGSLRDV